MINTDINISAAMRAPYIGMFSDNKEDAMEQFQTQLLNECSTEKTTTPSKDGKLLGIGFLSDSSSNSSIVSYAMVASYADESTDDNPIVQVLVGKPEGKAELYNISINKIDPSRATELEMFALCNYLDDKGMGTGGTFGTWQDLKVIDINASVNGYTEDTGILATFNSRRKDWGKICKMMMEEYLGVGVKTFQQYKNCVKLDNTFQKFHSRNAG